MKRLLIRIIALSLCVGLMGSVLGVTAAAEEGEGKYNGIGARGVWHRPNSSGRETTLSGLCSVLDEMADAGVNMVYVESFYHGMAVFKTDLVPYYTGFDKYNYGDYPDYLTAFATEAEKRGIEVHAWVENFYIGVNENTALVKRYPTWLLVNESGEIRHTTEGASLGGYIFLDPANKSVRDFLLSLYDEMLTNVPSIKGINLDYIRYPISSFYSGTDTGYTNFAMSKFSGEQGFSVSGSNRREDFKAYISENSLIDQWTAFRADSVTAFVKEIFEMTRESHPECIISVATHPDISNAYNEKKQDFMTWVDMGYIDVVTPMVYHYGASQISASLKEMLAKFKGVYCYSGLYSTYHSQSVSEFREHLAASDGCGADGFVLFESVKTFYSPAYDYAEFLHSEYAENSTLAALPHWSAERLIDAAAEIIADSLSENGEKQEIVGELNEQMQRIRQIGEQSAEDIDSAIEEIKGLRDYLSSGVVGEDSAAEAVDTLDLLSEYLGVRKTRLTFKGLLKAEQPPENPPTDPDDDEGGNENGDPDEEEKPNEEAPGEEEKPNEEAPGEEEKPDEDTSPDGTENEEPEPQKVGFLEAIRAFFLAIVSWFKKLFSPGH